MDSIQGNSIQGNNAATPIQKLKDEYQGNRIYMKREDLLPFSFGGNKLRIAMEYVADMHAEGKNLMIAYGNARSNLCRTVANLCSHECLPCIIVSPSDEDGGRINTFNLEISRICDASVIECRKDNVAATLERLFESCSKNGIDPYYIYGNKYGVGREAVPVRAYAYVYNEILKQEEQMGVVFDYIFLAVGTGTTMAGLLCGAYEQQYRHSCGNRSIIGISIARMPQKAIETTKKYVEAYYKSLKRDCVDIEPEISGVMVSQDRGYGYYDSSIIDMITHVLKHEGIPLDLTYTGKAYCGMREYILTEGIENKNILFMHTGGTPLFFDYLSSLK